MADLVVMEVVSALLSLAGIVLSIIALLKARSAQEAARSVVRMKDDQEDRQRLRDLISVLSEARKVSLAKANPHPSLKGIVRDDYEAVGKLVDAAEALRATLPLSWDRQKRDAFEGPAKSIDSAIDAIRKAPDEMEGWKIALLELRRAIPKLEKEERELANSALRHVA